MCMLHIYIYCIYMYIYIDIYVDLAPESRSPFSAVSGLYTWSLVEVACRPQSLQQGLEAVGLA